MKITKRTILRERDDPDGIKYRIYYERPLTGEEIRQKEDLVQKELIDAVPDTAKCNLHTTQESKEEARQWFNEHTPDDHEITGIELWSEKREQP